MWQSRKMMSEFLPWVSPNIQHCATRQDYAHGHIVLPFSGIPGGDTASEHAELNSIHGGPVRTRQQRMIMHDLAGAQPVKLPMTGCPWSFMAALPLIWCQAWEAASSQQRLEDHGSSNMGICTIFACCYR